jgi:hypothetical protein
MKSNCESETLINQELHLPLQMSTSETAQDERETTQLQNNIKAKPK